MEWLLEGGERDQCREQGQAGGTMDMTFPLWGNPPPPVPYPQPVPSYRANDRAKLIIAGASSSDVTHCNTLSHTAQLEMIIPNCLLICLDPTSWFALNDMALWYQIWATCFSFLCSASSPGSRLSSHHYLLQLQRGVGTGPQDVRLTDFLPTWCVL